MYLIKETRNTSLSAIRGGKDQLLLKTEKELLKELSVTLNIIHGGQFKSSSRHIR
jgi:hypothetical protein